VSVRTPAIVLGGTGYVAGELLRLLGSHPYFDLAAVASDSQPDEPVAKFFRHLQPMLPHLRFTSHDEIVEYVTANDHTAIFSAAPHGVSAALIDKLLGAAEQGGHAAPGRRHLGRLPVRERGRLRGRVQAPARCAGADPGVHLRGTRAPQRAADAARGASRLLCDGRAARERPAAVAGTRRAPDFRSRRDGQHRFRRQPTPGTHHPQRHSDLYSYNALTHRHAPEIRALAQAASGTAADFAFVPHSGPFARAST